MDTNASVTRHEGRRSARHRGCGVAPAPRRWRARTALAFALALGGCVQIRLLTYPAEFVWLGDEAVRGAMHRMAESIERLDLLAVPTDDLAPADADALERAVDEELARIEEIALALAAGSSPEGGALPRTNHLLIDEHIEEFLADVTRARRLVAADTPSYYAVGELVGSCAACHRYR